MTNPPLHPDGGIDWEKLETRRLNLDDFRFSLGKVFVAHTLERVAKWHDGKEALARNSLAFIAGQAGKQSSAYAQAEAEAIFHQQSAAAIRAMKP